MVYLVLAYPKILKEDHQFIQNYRKLYKNLRFDIDFIPHIGIGNSEDVKVCKNRVDELNKKSLLIEGSVDMLDIVKHEDNKITTIKTVGLI